MAGTRRKLCTAFPHALLLALVLAVAACSTPSKPNGNGGSGVQWGDYAAGLQSKIDGLAGAKDCAGLQDEFDTADANNAATLSRTGHNNAELMGYIDDKMRAADCDVE